MKKIIEIKRGDPVPLDAKWLQSIKIQNGCTKTDSGDGGVYMKPNMETFDVFEMSYEEAQEIKPV